MKKSSSEKKIDSLNVDKIFKNPQSNKENKKKKH